MKELSVLAAMMASRDISTSELAELANLNQPHLSEVIKGKKGMSKEKLNWALEVLGYTPKEYEYLQKYLQKINEKNLTEEEAMKQWGNLLLNTLCLLFTKVNVPEIHKEKKLRKARTKN